MSQRLILKRYSFLMLDYSERLNLFWQCVARKLWQVLRELEKKCSIPKYFISTALIQLLEFNCFNPAAWIQSLQSSCLKSIASIQLPEYNCFKSAAWIQSLQWSCLKSIASIRLLEFRDLNTTASISGVTISWQGWQNVNANLKWPRPKGCDLRNIF